MRFTCPQQILADAVNTVSRVVPSHHALPVLNNILLEARPKELTLTATNLEMAVVKKIPITTLEEGALTIPSKIFSQFITLLPQEEITLTTSSKNELSIKTTHSNTVVKGVPAEDFPTIPTLSNTKTIELPSEQLLEALSHTLTAAASGDMHPVLASILFDIRTDSVHLVATDSYRLAQYIIPLKTNTQPERIIVPIRAAQELSRILTKTKEPTQVSFSTNQAHVVHGNTTLLTRLIEGKYPPYEQIIPTSFNTRAVVGAAALVAALRRASIFSHEGARSVQVRIESSTQSINIVSNTEQAGSEQVSVPGEVTGDDRIIAFNVFYLIDALARVRSEQAVLEITTETSPAVIRSSEVPEALHIVMPLKL